MEVLNPSTRSSSHFLSGFPFFPPKFPLTKWKQKSSRFKPVNSKFQPHGPFSHCFSLSNSRRFEVSAYLGRRSARRNHLREKLTEEQQQVRQNRILSEPGLDFRNSGHELEDTDEFRYNLEISSVEQPNVDESGNVNESKFSGFEESVLMKKLGSWFDQYKADSEFWGVGSGPIFTVFQNSDGHVERVVVNEDEIIKRSQINRSFNSKHELDVLKALNSKISHAKSMAREIETGNNLLPSNSPIAKFIVSNGNSGLVDVIRGFNVQKGLVSRIGFTVLCGFFVFWTVKGLFNSGERKQKLTGLEKEMMRRKLKARIEKNNSLKGNVEVIQEAKEPLLVSIAKPSLDKQQLKDNIFQENESNNDKLELQEFSSKIPSESSDFDDQIQEIRAMARHAREIETGDLRKDDSNEENDQTMKELPSEKDVALEDGGGDLGFENVKPDGYWEKIQNLSGGSKGEGIDALGMKIQNDAESIITRDLEDSVCDFNSLDGATVNQAKPEEFSKELPSEKEVASEHRNFIPNGYAEKIQDLIGISKGEDITILERRNTKTSNSLDLKFQSDGENITRNLEDRMSDFNSLGSANLSQANPDEVTVRAKPKIIKSVKEAKEYLSKKGQPKATTTQKVDYNVDSASKKQTYGRPRPRLLKKGKTFGSSTFSMTRELIIKRKGKIIEPEEDRLIDPQIGSASSSVLLSPIEEKTENDESKIQPPNLVGTSDSSSTLISCGDGNGKGNCQMPGTSLSHENNEKSAEMLALANKENWVEKNFNQFEPIVEKIGLGFRNNYMVAREKTDRLSLNTQMILPKSDEEDGELAWMKDENLRDIVFKVRDNELAGGDPFYLMDVQEKLAFFSGLEKQVETVNKELLNVHEWVHSNIENIDYGADGISLYDLPEKIIPRWKGLPPTMQPEFLNNSVDKRKTTFSDSLENSNIMKNDTSATLNRIDNQDRKKNDGGSRTPRTVIEGSDGSIRAGKKSGKEFWQHTKKWSQGFIDAYNAETDPEIKAVMRNIGKDLDRWITEKDLKEAVEYMDNMRKRGRKYFEEKINKVKREVVLFGPQAVASKYREYGDEKGEDYLWWLDLPSVLCIEMYTIENGQQKVGFYSLEMAPDLELEPKPNHVIAFEDAGDSKNFCYIMQAHLEMIGLGNAFVVARPPKDAFREAKSNGFSVTVIRKGELQLNVDQPLEEVEEEIIEIGSKIYHDKITKERSVDIRSIMKGAFATTKKPAKRKIWK